MNHFFPFKMLWCLLCLAFALPTSAQFANDWIDHSLTYHTFQVGKTGIYRINQATLNEAGINLNAAELQLYNQGKQLPIYVSTNGTMGADDYIEFYAKENDGTFDTQLFESPNYQLQTYTSLFTKQNTYFLTSTPNGPHLRVEELNNDISNPPNAEPYFMYESIKVTDDTYHFGAPYYVSGSFSYFSTFDEGEGWVGSVVRDLTNFAPVGENTGVDVRVPTEALYDAAAEQASVTARVVGRNVSTGVIDDKQIEIFVNGNSYVDALFSQFEIVNYSFDLPLGDIDTSPHPITGDVETRVNFKAWDGTTNGYDYETRYSTAYVSITYPRTFDFNNQGVFNFTLKVDEEKYFEVSNFAGGDNPVLYDLTNSRRIAPIVDGELYKFKLNSSPPVDRDFFISSADSIQLISNLESKTFVDYSNANNQGNYLIISHSSLQEGAVDQIERYANYRSSSAGGNHTVVVADIDELYEQFAWGIEKHPMSIKNFINFAIDNWATSPEHVLLIGDGIRYDKTLRNEEAFDNCLIPPYGYTATDLMFTTETTHDYYPQVAIGRIPAQTADQVRAYLDKVEEYENWYNLTNDCNTITDRLWMKSALHIAKGWGQNETDIFQEDVDSYTEAITSHLMGYTMAAELQDIRGPIPNGETNWFFDAPEVATTMEAGLSMVTYAGHASPYENYWQFDFQHPNTYNNEGKYPFMQSNSCFVGKISDFDDGQTCMSEDYVLADNRGAIAFMGAVALSSPGYLDIYTNVFVDNIAVNHYGASIGFNVMKSIQDIYAPNDDGIRIVCNEFTLAGDPAISLYHWDEPEYLIEDLSSNVSETIDPVNTNEIELSFTVQNWGMSIEDNLDVNICLLNELGEIVNQESYSVESPLWEDSFTLTFPIVASTPNGNNQVVVKLDGNNLYVEACEEDNQANVTINFETSANISGCTDPCAPNYDISANVDDGSCEAPLLGCTDPCSSNYDPAALCDDGSCDNLLGGCTDVNACNYDSNASCDNGSCIYETICDPDICTNGGIYTWNAMNCQCELTTATAFGCTDVNACNYTPNANCDDGSCTYNCEACSTEFELKAGWNLISSACIPPNMSIADLFTSIEGDLIQVNNQIYLYNPSLNIDEFAANGIGWNHREAYRVKTFANTSLTLDGSAVVDIATETVQLNAGWNDLPYWLNVYADVEEVFKQLEGNLIQVKNLRNAYIPSLEHNGIGVLTPTEGYQIELSSATTLTYDLALTPMIPPSEGDLPPQPTHFSRNGQLSLSSSTFVFLDGRSAVGLEEGDEIGIFTPEGILAGSAVYQGGKTSLLVYGDDVTVEGKDGLEDGDAFTVKIWKQASDTESDAAFSIVEGPQMYKVNDLHIAMFDNIDGIAQLSGWHIGVAPNPSSNRVYFSIQTEQAHQNIEVQIYDLTGKQMDVIHSIPTSNASQYTIPYSVKDLESGMYLYKVIVDGQLLATERLTVVK